MAQLLHYPDIECGLPGFVCASSTRHGGVSQGAYASLNLGLHVGDEPSRVLENRSRFAAACGVDAAHMVWMRQVHGRRIETVGAARRGAGSLSMDDAVADCDGMICAEAGVFLAVGQADCLAAVVVDERKKVFGVVHAGWRGALAKAPAALLEAMVSQFKVNPRRLKVALSPALGPRRLELGPQWKSPFELAFGPAPDFLQDGKQGHFHLDLWLCVQSQLLDLGCLQENFTIQNLCTFEDESRFFSYRRGPQMCGRMATVAGFKVA
jgi:YfiH family protein